jgi:hypothetical protein
MAVENVEAKLQEAQSFLDKMRDQEQMAFSQEPFNHSLSAFLNAARTVDYRLRDECAIYKEWREEWNGKHPSQHRLIKSMVEKRRNEVHASGSGLIVKSKEIKVGSGSSYSDKSGILSVMGSPGPLIGAEPYAAISMPQYFFDIDGIERPVTEVCAECLTALRQMVAQYKTETSH